MSSLPLVPLGNLMASATGSVNPAGYPDEVFDLYSIPAFDLGEPEIVRGREVGSSKQVVRPNDVLLSKIVPHIRRSWVVGQDRSRRLIASGEWIVFRSDRVHPAYLRQVLVSDPFHLEFMSTVSGVGGSLLRARPAHVANLQIPLPSLPEQRRIADILDRADALRAKRREAIASLDALTQSIFFDMFGDPVANPKGWPEGRPLGDVANIVSGITKGRKLNGTATREVPYLAVVNVQDRRLELTTVKTIDATESEVERYRLRKGDLLLTEGGDPDKLGRGALWAEEIPECIHQNHIFRVRVVDPDLIPVYLNWLVGSERGKRYFLKSAKQTTGIATINQQQLRAFPLLIPPVALQNEFAVAIDRVAVLRDQMKASLRSFDACFASLQHSAFRGEL